MNPEDNPTPEPTSEKERELTIYCAAALGAFCLGVTDLLKNGTRAIVLELGQLFREMLFPSFGNVNLLALFVLVALGTAMCWLFQPPTRLDAFARGFSVFAVLAVATPGGEPPSFAEPVSPSLDSSGLEAVPPSDGIAPAAVVLTGYPARTAGLGPDDPLRRKWQRRPAGHGMAAVRIDLARSRERKVPPEITVTLRDASSAKIVGVDRSKDGRFVIVQPRGKYLLEIEAPGYRRTSFDLNLGGTLTGYSLVLEAAGTPMGLQRLVAPKHIRPKIEDLLKD